VAVAIAANDGAGFQTVDLRHLDIHEDKIKVLVLQRIDCFPALAG
jgi:hypothetical protein